MSLIRETCGCGAIWEGDSAFVEEREKFREAHVTCRTQPTPTHRYTMEEIREPEPRCTLAELLKKEPLKAGHDVVAARAGYEVRGHENSEATDVARFAIEAAFNKATDESGEGEG